MKGFYKNNFKMMKKEIKEDPRERKGSCENDCIMKSNEQIHAIQLKSNVLLYRNREDCSLYGGQ